jgi:hypothetical protein
MCHSMDRSVILLAPICSFRQSAEGGRLRVCTPAEPGTPLPAIHTHDSTFHILGPTHHTVPALCRYMPWGGTHSYHSIAGRPSTARASWPLLHDRLEICGSQSHTYVMVSSH